MPSIQECCKLNNVNLKNEGLWGNFTNVVVMPSNGVVIYLLSSFTNEISFSTCLLDLKIWKFYYSIISLKWKPLSQILFIISCKLFP